MNAYRAPGEYYLVETCIEEERSIELFGRQKKVEESNGKMPFREDTQPVLRGLLAQ